MTDLAVARLGALRGLVQVLPALAFLLVTGWSGWAARGQDSLPLQIEGQGEPSVLLSNPAPVEALEMPPLWRADDWPWSWRLWPKLRWGHGDPDDPHRHIGLGNPLVGTSWLNRPYHVDAQVGGLFGDEAINHRGGVLSTVRLGWDLDHYWGLETRFAYANPSLNTGAGQGTVQLLDGHVLYYPWGDAYWRPFVSVGSGIARYTYVDNTGQAVAQVIYQLPVSVGMKYLLRRWLALRFQFADNIGFSAVGDKTLHNLGISGGVEWHFGGRRRSYFPFDPDVHLP